MDARDIERLAGAQLTYVDETDPAVRDGWAIQDIGSLEWAMSRVADLEAEARENKEALAAAHRALDRRAGVLQEKVQKGIDFFRSAVLMYMEAHRGELLKGGKKKSRTMLYGTVGWRSSGGRLKVLDKDALAAWLLTQPVELGLARVTVDPNMVALQAYCAEHKMVPPGTEYELPHETAYVKAVAPGTTLTKTEGNGDDQV